MDKEDYSVMRKEEILPFETTWMKLEDIMLSDRERQILCDIIYMQNLKKNKTKLIETESRVVVTRGWGVRENKETLAQQGKPPVIR